MGLGKSSERSLGLLSALPSKIERIDQLVRPMMNNDPGSTSYTKGSLVQRSELTGSLLVNLAQQLRDIAIHLDRLAGEAQPKYRNSMELERVRNVLGLKNRNSVSLLLHLISTPGVVLKHNELCAMLESTRGALKVYICDLRTAFAAKGIKDAIQTVWGVGYCISRKNAMRIERIWS